MFMGMSVAVTLIMVVMVSVAVTLIMVVMVSVAVTLIMVMVMAMAVTLIKGMIMHMGGFMPMLRIRFPGTANFYRITSVSTSTGITHSYSFCSTNKDFTCISVPRISLMPVRLHSGQWLNMPSGV
jgi:hypothetical protein